MPTVFFKRPKYVPSGFFKLLRNVGFQAVDLHFHTEYGMDSVSHIDATLKKCKKKGFGVAITDHNEIKGALKAWKQKKDVFIIPGLEASTKRGVHSLFYFSRISDCKQFFNKIIKPLRKKNPFFLPIPIEELLEYGHDYNAYISVSHPYGPGVIGVKKVKFTKISMKRLERRFDFVEGFNAALLRKMNEKALHWANFIGKGITAGSDGHTTAELGNALTIAYGDDIDTYFDSIKKKRSILVGKESNLFFDAINQIVKEIKYFKSAKDMGKGLFWVKEHGREFHMIRKKIEKLGHKIPHPYELLHHKSSSKKHEKAYKQYLKLGEGLFK